MDKNLTDRISALRFMTVSNLGSLSDDATPKKREDLHVRRPW
jgi:hypothetical protein